MVGQGATQWAKDHGIETVTVDSLKTGNASHVSLHDGSVI